MDRYTLTKEDILADLKIDFAELFEAELSEGESCLRLKFSNGQTFIISVEEEK